MNDKEDAGASLLAAIEAMHQELREMRKEALAGREVREELDSVRDELEQLRGAGRRRSQEWRARNVTQRHRDVTTGHLVLKALDQKQEQVLKAPKTRHRNVSNVTTQPTREAYSAAYRKRHGADPIWNATTNGQLSRFVQRVGIEEAPSIAEFYLGHRGAFYVQKIHPVGLLLQDAEKLRTEWFTGRTVTATEAREQDKTQANLDGWEALRRKPNGVVG